MRTARYWVPYRTEINSVRQQEPVRRTLPKVKGIITVLLGAIVRTPVGGSSVGVKGHYVNVVRLEGSVSDATVTVEAV
ncbi:hypothetical protein B296_00056061 [Ensete ventricosum]|uniref:Uncharacterized protein n=1 Tax=Ensete ventricosum TaxID=4639 RepID=A0A426XX00_ENSVE|nr:hypothetical protein B296_00056061 [Ensete ventricosum]